MNSIDFFTSRIFGHYLNQFSSLRKKRGNFIFVWKPNFKKYISLPPSPATAPIPKSLLLWVGSADDEAGAADDDVGVGCVPSDDVLLLPVVGDAVSVVVSLLNPW